MVTEGQNPEHRCSRTSRLYSVCVCVCVCVLCVLSVCVCVYSVCVCVCIWASCKDVLNFYFLFSWWSDIRLHLCRTVASNKHIVHYQVSDKWIWNAAGSRGKIKTRYRSVTMPTAKFPETDSGPPLWEIEDYLPALWHGHSYSSSKLLRIYRKFLTGHAKFT
jgi:hypothetical protein